MDYSSIRKGLVLILIGVGALVAMWWHHAHQPQAEYHSHQGYVFGTYYNIRYRSTQDLEPLIQQCLHDFDFSLSTFNPQSVISAINQGRDTVTDRYFEQMMAEAERVSRLSDGAFDITVAPLVNLWGFGFKHREQATDERIDSLLQMVGYQRVCLEDHHLLKQDPRILLDASAVAKGQACDVVAEALAEAGCEHLLVDIGGEVVARGVNAQGAPWRIGINKPIEDSTSMVSEIERVVESTDICMATSGNYRNFYYDGEQKRSHTIDPRTGRPVQHSLLSATVVSSSCMRADALATACMVLGRDGALDLIARSGDSSCLLIVAEGDSTRVYTSPNWQ